VNGDDILFKANHEFYRLWQLELKKIGFELSVGKSYFSKCFLTVNSKLYVLKHRADKIEYELVSFFNPALSLPRRYIHKEESANRADEDPLVGRLSEALSRASDPRLAFEIFKYFNIEDIRSATMDGRLNLFIHPILGGLGANPGKMKFRITRYQRQLAHTLWNGDRQSHPLSLTSSSISRGFLPVNARIHAVIASVPPAPRPDISGLNREKRESGSRFWKFDLPKIDKSLRKLKTLSAQWIREFFGTWEIVPCESNDDLLIDIAYGDAIGMPFGRVSGSLACPQPA